MSSPEIHKTLLDKSQETITLTGAESFSLKTKDGLSLNCNSKGEIDIAFGNHKLRFNFEESTLKSKDLGIEIKAR